MPGPAFPAFEDAMSISPYLVMPCLLIQAAAQSPLSFQQIQAKARPAPEQWRTEALLAQSRFQLQETRSFLREGPTLAFQAGPRRGPEQATTTDQGLELDLPLFLSPKVRADLEKTLGQAHPLLLEAARRAGKLRLRTAYLDAWLATQLLAFRETDLATVERWLQAAKVRFEAGADPAYQVALVEGERLKLQQDLFDARTQAARAWGGLVALAEVGATPVPLADPGPVPTLPMENLTERLQAGPMRLALLAQAQLEADGTRLRQAQGLSRWSLRGSFAREGQERVTRIGLAVRLPRPGESSALRSSTETQLLAARGEARQALAELDARALGAADRFQRMVDAAPAPDFTQAIQAVGLRLQEGRERPSDALPIRRQFLEAQMASVRRVHSQHLLAAELLALLPEVHS
jgi:hypothetical protein